MIEAAEILKEELIQLNEDDAEIYEENFNQLVQNWKRSMGSSAMFYRIKRMAK